MNEDAQSEIHQVSQFHESHAVSQTYLGEANMRRQNTFRAQEQFSLTDQSITIGTSLDGKIVRYL